MHGTLLYAHRKSSSSLFSAAYGRGQESEVARRNVVRARRARMEAGLATRFARNNIGTRKKRRNRRRQA